MIKFEDKIRLTSTEAELFSAVAVDSNKAPTTVQEHNDRLDLAAQTWSEGETAEEKLLAALAGDLKI